MLEMDKKLSCITVTRESNGKMNFIKKFLDIVLVWLEIFFNFVWLLFEGLNEVNPQLLAIPNIHVKYFPIYYFSIFISKCIDFQRKTYGNEPFCHGNFTI